MKRGMWWVLLALLIVMGLMVAGCSKGGVNGSAPSSSPASVQQSQTQAQQPVQQSQTQTQQPVQQPAQSGQQSVLIGQYNLGQGQAEMKLVLHPITDECLFALPTSPNDLVGEYLVVCQGAKNGEYGFNPVGWVKRVPGYPMYSLVGKISGNTYQGYVCRNNTAVGQFTLHGQ